MRDGAAGAGLAVAEGPSSSRRWPRWRKTIGVLVGAVYRPLKMFCVTPLPESEVCTDGLARPPIVTVKLVLICDWAPPESRT